jgi:hypothetical protein
VLVLTRDVDRYGGNRRCNLCSLAAIYRANPGVEFDLVVKWSGWVSLYRDGRLVASFARLPTECACST